MVPKLTYLPSKTYKEFQIERNSKNLKRSLRGPHIFRGITLQREKKNRSRFLVILSKEMVRIIKPSCLQKRTNSTDLQTIECKPIKSVLSP